MFSLHTRRDGDPERIHSALPRHKRGQWVGPGRKRTATVPGENGVVELAPARGPPTSWAELVQVHDDRDAIQASPQALPVIDIRSL